MTRAITSTCLIVFSACAVSAQTPAFEVASIKQAAPMSGGKMMMGFGGDEGRINYTNVSLKDVVARAYRMKPYQVSGPSWLESERYNITAKIPEGARDQTPEMLQNLLAERFHMTAHKESKELPIYALIVGKNGPKLKKSDETDDKPMTAQDGPKVAMRNKQDSEKMAGAGKGTMLMDTTGRLQANKATMGDLADMMSRMLDRPVMDMTGIEGRYDVTLEISMEDLIGMKRMAAGMGAMHGGGDGPAPEGNPRASMFSAVQQLGLKLDPRKAPVDFLVVDKAEKAATEN
jgi:uncharacterized protein (TIGR03435 family)